MILFLVTACFDNNGFLGVVTLKSPGGGFCCIGFPHSKTNHRVNLLSTALSIIGDLFVLPCALYINLIN